MWSKRALLCSPSRRLKRLRRAQLSEPTNSNGLRARRERGAVNWVHPAYANGHIVIRNDNEIVRASLLAK